MNPHLRHGREVGCVHVAVAEGFEAPDGELFDSRGLLSSIIGHIPNQMR